LNIKVIMRNTISPLKQKPPSNAHFDTFKSFLPRDSG